MPRRKKKKRKWSSNWVMRVVYRDYFYNTEVLNIAHDYVAGLRKQDLAQAR